MEQRYPFADPEFLQSVGRMTISFALLEGAMNAVLNQMDEIKPLREISEMKYSKRVDRLIEVARSQFTALGSTTFDSRALAQINSELKSVADFRNSVIHDFWTIQDDKLHVKSLKGKGVPESYPTPGKISGLSDRIWAVRERLADLINEYTRRKEET